MADKRVPVFARSAAGGRMGGGSAAWGLSGANGGDYPPGGAETFARMQRDAQVRACLTTKKLSVLSETVEVHPNGDSPDALRAANVVRETLAGLPNGGAVGIVSGALDALATGWAIAELVWRLDGSLGEVRWHDPRRFRLHADPLRGDIDTITVTDADLALPADRFVRYVYQARYQSPWGESDLVAAYEPWSRKQTIRRLWLTALDRFGSPLPIAKVPNGYRQEDCDRLAAQLSATGGDSSLVIPADVVIETVLDSGRVEPARAFGAAIEYEDTQIARAILGQELTTQSGGSGSSFALGRVHQDVLDDWITALRADLAASLLTGQIARRIVETALGPNVPVPVVRFPNLSPAEQDARVRLASALVSGKVVAPNETWLRSYLGIPAASAPTETTTTEGETHA